MSAGRNLDRRLAVQGRNGEITSQGSESKRQRDFTEEIGIVSLKHLMFFHMNDHVEVSGATSLTTSITVTD